MSARSCVWIRSIPTPCMKSTAAPKPIASTIGGVPASNLAGTGAGV